MSVMMKVESRAAAIGEMRRLVAKRRSLNAEAKRLDREPGSVSPGVRPLVSLEIAATREKIGEWLATHGPAYRDADAGEVYVLDTPGGHTWSPYGTRPDAPCVCNGRKGFESQRESLRRTLASHGLDPVAYGVAP